MGKRKRSNGDASETKNHARVYMHCRKFVGSSDKEIKEYIEHFGFHAKRIKKEYTKPRASVDVKSPEEAAELVEELGYKEYGGDVLTASTQPIRKPKIAHERKVTMSDRMLYIKKLTINVSKKKLKRLFRGAESITVSQKKKNREALLVFRTPKAVAEAIRDFRGFEKLGQDSILEELVPESVTEAHFVKNEFIDEKYPVKLEKVKQEVTGGTEEKEDNNNIQHSMLDCTLCIVGVTKQASKKTLKELFDRVQSVVISCQTTSKLRDAVLVFKTPDHVAQAIRDFQELELDVEKPILEKLAPVPVEKRCFEDYESEQQ